MIFLRNPSTSGSHALENATGHLFCDEEGTNLTYPWKTDHWVTVRWDVKVCPSYSLLYDEILIRTSWESVVLKQVDETITLLWKEAH